MGYSQTTPNLKLPLYTATDKPSYLGDWNVSQGIVDSSVTDIKNTVTTTNANLVTVQNITNQNTASITEHQNWLSKLPINSDLTATQFSEKVNKAGNDSASALSTATSAQSNVSKLNTRVQEAENGLAVLTTGKANVNHAANNTNYGGATSSLYGHVTLSDSTASSQTASSSVAASPAAVKTVNDSLTNLSTKVSVLEQKVNKQPIAINIGAAGWNTRLIYDEESSYATVRAVPNVDTTITGRETRVVGTIPVAQRPAVNFQQLVVATPTTLVLEVKSTGAVQYRNIGTNDIQLDPTSAFIQGFFYGV